MNNRRYSLRSDPNVILVPPLHTNRRVHNNLVSATTSDASTTMSTEQPSSDVPPDPTAQASVADTLSTILAQLTTINKRLEIQSEAISRHDRILDGSSGVGGPARSPDKTTKTANSASNGTGSANGAGNGTNGDTASLLGHAQQRDLRDDFRNSFHRSKINFPRYDGETDPLSWLNRCEFYFRGTRTMLAEQVWLASLHMDGVDDEWYYALERDYGILPWARFAEFINLRFGPPIRSNPLGELKELHRTGTMEDYQRQFLQLLYRCDDLSPTHQMNLSTAGLGEPMTSDVEMQRAADLQAAMSLAQAFERRATAATTPPTQAPRLQYQPRLPTTSNTPSAASNTSAAPSTGSTRSRFRCLSPEEMADKRKMGEYYFCPDKFTPDHKYF
jgi:hypothetical protein